MSPLPPSSSSHHCAALRCFLFVGLVCSLCNVLYLSLFQVFPDPQLYRHGSSVSSSFRTIRDIEENPKLPNDANPLPLAQRQIQTLPQEWPPSSTAETDPIRQLLREALGGDAEEDRETMARLPTVSDVTALYGATPVVLGLETCASFQHNNLLDAAEHLVAVAGSFNTGTNLLAELLIANCVMPERQRKYGTHGVRWQVLWGKHTPVDDEGFRRSHRTYSNATGRNQEPPIVPEAIFPAVTIRDPFKWMQSMCRHSYGAHWKHDPQHCPNLVPNVIDEALLEMEEPESVSSTDTIPVTVQYAEFSRNHSSLVGFWNDWNRAYAQAPFPRLMVRFEDLIFHPQQITSAVCACAGGEPSAAPFVYVVDSAKKGAAHGTQKTSYVDALVQYGTEVGRYTGFTSDDLRYAQEHLDPDLMRLFGYRYPRPEVLARMAR